MGGREPPNRCLYSKTKPTASNFDKHVYHTSAKDPFLTIEM